MTLCLVVGAGVLAGLSFAQDDTAASRPATRPAAPSGALLPAFLDATFEDAKPSPPASPLRSVVVADSNAATTRKARAKAPGAIVATHELRAARPVSASAGQAEIEAAALEPFLVGHGATFERGGDRAVEGFVRTVALGADRVLVLAAVPAGADSTLRLFGLARRQGASTDLPERLVPLRRASVYAAPDEGGQLDAFVVENAQVASEAPFTEQGVSIAGAGDRPRRFMRGHRFAPGKQLVASVRYCDPHGGSVRVSVSWTPGKSGPRLATARDVSVAVTELMPDLESGRTLESVSGVVDLEPIASGGARLRLTLDARMRLVGGHDPQRFLIFGDFDCAPVGIDLLTPWLGRYNPGRPVLETFAVPDEADR